MNTRSYIITIAVLLLLAGLAVANGTSTIHGVVYGWDTFEPLDNSVIEVNSTPSQSMVAKYGLYSFDLAPGTYLITARYYENSSLVYSTEKPITIDSQGSYVLDLLLLPVYSEELMDSYDPDGPAETQEISGETSENTYGIKKSEASSPTGLQIFTALLVFLLFAGTYRYTRKNKKGTDEPGSGINSVNTVYTVSTVKRQESQKPLEPEPIIPESGIKPIEEKGPASGYEEVKKVKETERPEKVGTVGEAERAEEAREPEVTEMPEDSEKPRESEESKKSEESKESEDFKNKQRKYLPPDLQEIMDIIRGQGGRITQKDLRGRIRYSEGKVSLMLADLERRGLIEKFKRGRGNVIILADEEL